MSRHGWLSVVAARSAAVLAAVLALAACGTGGADSPDGRPDRWTVSASDPGTGLYEQCLEDPLVEESYVSADYPASHLGISLAGAATDEDAQRVAECLRQALPSAKVSVMGPQTGS
ncbi:hypothetical protein MUK71_08945 [Arthrobacter zhangbolii]|uniref:Lipoprotein n=1 Tax=Arthrobacter zhangbolii TaxID=2886936 RepID=A0A9X1S8L8_9MICC|nr:hypothetical protein [Arthrobacter zhangbolii]MCC3271452.1 hypothetical protein [Arthrobacter zhangbolii]UON90774.1 hypothetical protein MUK71_08945 [Arthrobacter zhangbolii]